MTKHKADCRDKSCTGCGSSSYQTKAIELQEKLDAEIEGSRKEYNRGQRYKKQRNELEEENTKLKSEVAELTKQVTHWKDQTDQWQDQFCEMTKIRDRFVKERDTLKAMWEEGQKDYQALSHDYHQLKHFGNDE